MYNSQKSFTNELNRAHQIVNVRAQQSEEQIVQQQKKPEAFQLKAQVFSFSPKNPNRLIINVNDKNKQPANKLEIQPKESELLEYI